MKKYLILILILLIPFNCHALEKNKVELDSCIDGDTANFIMNKKVVKVRFIAIDTPEIKHQSQEEEPYGQKAKNFTCSKLNNAKKIELEFDEKSKKKDKYNRYLAWVFVDDKLLQNELVRNGLAEVTYLYDSYKYVDILKESETQAKLNKKGIYSDDASYENIQIIIYNFYKKLKADVNSFFKDIIKEIDKKSI